jgi:hypothetical protein
MHFQLELPMKKVDEVLLNELKCESKREIAEGQRVRARSMARNTLEG